MARVCANCGFENVTGRTICKQCQTPLFTGATAPVFQADGAYTRRFLLSLFGAIFVPLGILLLYVIVAGDTAFDRNGVSQLDEVAMIAAFLGGMFFVGIAPARVWTRVGLAILYLPIFGVGLVYFLLYFACVSGRGCV